VGSSSLARTLACNPEVLHSESEMFNFWRLFPAMRDWRAYSLALPVITPEDIEHGIILGDKTPAILEYIADPQQLRKEMPDTLLFMTLREPVEHMLASFWHSQDLAIMSNSSMIRYFCDLAGRQLDDMCHGLVQSTQCSTNEKCWFDMLHACIKPKLTSSQAKGIVRAYPWKAPFQILQIPSKIEMYQRSGYVINDTLGIYFAEEFFMNPVNATANILAFLGKDHGGVNALACMYDVGIINTKTRVKASSMNIASLEQDMIPPSLLSILNNFAKVMESDLQRFIPITPLWDIYKDTRRAADTLWNSPYPRQ
jgi:hypothetical protein